MVFKRVTARVKTALDDRKKYSECLILPQICVFSSVLVTIPKQRRVLVVEDSIPCGHLFEAILARAGHLVTVITDVKNALSALNEEKYDALICDLILPDGNGCQVVQSLRHSGNEMFAVAVTGLIPIECEAEALAAGFDEYLLKPVRPAVLVKMLA